MLAMDLPMELSLAKLGARGERPVSSPPPSSSSLRGRTQRTRGPVRSFIG
jgi:hypothetical protein